MFATEVTSVIERFEGESNLRAFLKELESGRTSLKYAYVGPAAGTHDELAKRDGYRTNVDATSIEARLMERSSLEECVDIGPGNSIHSLQVFRELDAKCRPRRTLLLDFSRTLLAVCCGRMQEAGVPELSQSEWDFESGPTGAIRIWRSSRVKPVLAMIIGHTLGNPADLPRVLRNVGDSLEPSDRLLVSVALRTEDDPLPNYRTPEFLAAATEPFRMIGLSLAPARLQLDLNASGSVVAQVVLTSGEIAQIHEQYGATARRRIQCFESRRFDQEDVPRFALGTRLFFERDRLLSEDGSHAGFVFERVAN